MGQIHYWMLWGTFSIPVQACVCGLVLFTSTEKLGFHRDWLNFFARLRAGQKLMTTGKSQGKSQGAGTFAIDSERYQIAKMQIFGGSNLSLKVIKCVLC